MLKQGDTLLFVSKDMGGANVGIPLVRLAIESGYKEVVVAEGLAAGKYEDAGFRLYFKGTVNFSDEPFSLDAERVVQKLEPSAVVTTLGVPIYLEQEFGFAANHLGIPLVFLEDFWGVHIRSQAKPDLVLSIDQRASEIARERYGSVPTIAVVGNHAVSNALRLEVPSELQEIVGGLRRKFGRVLVCTVYGTHGSKQIQLLKECLNKTPDWVLIPRFHPKMVNLPGPTGKTFGDEWHELLEELGERVVYVESKVSDPLVGLADATLSDFSTMLTTSLAFGRPAISVVTPEVRETMKQEIGFTSHPLSDHLREPDPSKVQQYLQPYWPDKALRAIEAL